MDESGSFFEGTSRFWKMSLTINLNHFFYLLTTNQTTCVRASKNLIWFLNHFSCKWKKHQRWTLMIIKTDLKILKLQFKEKFCYANEELFEKRITFKLEMAHWFWSTFNSSVHCAAVLCRENIWISNQHGHALSKNDLFKVHVSKTAQ